MDENIKKCVCGGIAKLHFLQAENDDCYVKCENCGKRTSYYGFEEPAIEEWNKKLYKRVYMTDKEKAIVIKLSHPFYTVEFLEHWINRNDDVFVNAPSALQAMGAKGYYDAVKQIALLDT